MSTPPEQPWPDLEPRCPSPPPTFTTERLLLRPINHDDLPLYRSTFGDPDVMATVLKRTESEHELRERVARYADSWQRHGSLHVFAVAPRHSLHNPTTNTTLPAGTPVGDAMLVPIARQGPEFELGYRFAKHAWHLGLATEAATPVLRYALHTLNLERVVAVTDPDNHPSQRVLTKLGFTPQGHTDRYYNQTTALFQFRRTTAAAPTPEPPR